MSNPSVPTRRQEISEIIGRSWGSEARDEFEIISEGNLTIDELEWSYTFIDRKYSV